MKRKLGRRIKVRLDNKLLPTNTFILTFSVPILPPSIKAGCLNIPVEPFIPNSLRCFKCQRLDMDRTHVVANLYVHVVVFQTMTVRHARKILFVPTAKESTVHTRKSGYCGNRKHGFIRLGYTTCSHFKEPESW